jgi:sugar (pentulose or hexulose) kinase
LSVQRIFVGGGGAKSSLWLQIHADVLQKPIHLTRETESCALGSALVAAVRARCYPDLESAARHMVAIERVVEPNLANRAVYDNLFERYVALYHDLNDD